MCHIILTQRRRVAECAESFRAAARLGTPQRGAGGWHPDIKPCLCVTMKSVLNAKPPLTAPAYSPLLGHPLRGQASPGGYASLRLCVKHLYTFYMFYTAIIFSFRVFSVFRGSNLCVLYVLCGYRHDVHF